MIVIFHNTEIDDSFEVSVLNLVHLYDYLKANKPEIFREVATKELSYTVYDESKEKAYPILPSMLDYDISQYAYLVIMPKVAGEAIFTAIAVGVTAAVASAIGTGIVATAIGYAVATVVVVGIIIALGMLVKALMPQNKIDNNTDPSTISKLYNGVPNITEQGGSVPVVFGNCLVGGVRIGLKFEVALDSYDDTRLINGFGDLPGLESQWLRLA